MCCVHIPVEQWDTSTPCMLWAVLSKHPVCCWLCYPGTPVRCWQCYTGTPVCCVQSYPGTPVCCVQCYTGTSVCCWQCYYWHICMLCAVLYWHTCMLLTVSSSEMWERAGLCCVLVVAAAGSSVSRTIQSSWQSDWCVACYLHVRKTPSWYADYLSEALALLKV